MSKPLGVNGPLWCEFRKLCDAIEWGYADVAEIDGNGSIMRATITIDAIGYEALRTDITDHARMARRLESDNDINWAGFLSIRKRLFAHNDIVRAIVSMNEVGVRQKIDAHTRGT